jgi:hypothetical protein
MHSTNPVGFDKPAVVQQLDIFGGHDEISVATSGVIRRTEPTAAKLHDAPAPSTKPVNPGLQRRAAAKPAPASVTAPTVPARDPAHAHEALLVDPDEPVVIDLELTDVNDTPEMILAKRMLLRMMWDIAGKTDDIEPDLFGQRTNSDRKAKRAENDRFSALVWLYDLHPDEPRVSFGWVCDMLDLDPHRIRRIVGRSMRGDLKRLVHLLSTIVGPKHAQACEEKISDYLDISNWSFN